MLPTPISRSDKYLDTIAQDGGGGQLPKPISREDKYLYEIARNGGGGGGSVIIDDFLSTESENSVQNKVIAMAFAALEARVAALEKGTGPGARVDGDGNLEVLVKGATITSDGYLELNPNEVSVIDNYLTFKA